MVEIRIAPIESARRFLDIQRAFYRDDPHYVPPLTHVERWQVDPRRNPFFEHAEVGRFAAFRGREVVGRVSTTRDALHDEFHGDRVGFFGHFEAADERVAAALLTHAADWLRARGAQSLRGPVDLSTNYRCGLLVEGEPGPPRLSMPYNPPAYAQWIEASGLTKAKDLLALRMRQRDLQIDRMTRIVERLRKRSRVTMRPLDLSNFDAEVEVLWDLYHRIWERNWGFVPMSKGEFRAQAKDLKGFVVPAMAPIALLDGKPIAFGIGLPDANVGIRACNGRLFPFGFLKFLRAMKHVHRIRVLTLGIVPEHRTTGVDSLLVHEIIVRGIERGFDECECSWVLEDNVPMLKPLRDMGAQEYRRYRIYEKALSPE